jgi:phosphate transport system substrate-binding protein
MIFRAIARRRNWLILALTVAFSLITLRADSSTSLLGGGSSFAESLYSTYAPAFAEDTTDEFRYLAVGDAPAYRQMQARVFSFTSTDARPGPGILEILQTDQAGLQMVPTGIGGLAVICNLRGAANEIAISRDVLAGIFTGNINNWQQVNPRLPDLDIRLILRDDFSGANYVLSQYLNAITEGEVEVRPGPRWWQDLNVQPYLSRSLDAGATAAVASTEGAIGYVEVGYALAKNLETAKIENSQGQFISPSLDSIAQSAALAKYDENFFAEGLVDPAEGYPLVALNWLAMYKDQPDEATAAGLKSMVTWVLTEGQKLNESVGFIPVPADVAQQAIAAVNRNL